MTKFPYRTLTILVVTVLTGCTSAFTAPAVISCSIATSSRVSPLNAYVPDGLSKDEYEKIKKVEQNKFKGVNLGRLGSRGFKSRCMEAWQKAYEQGQAQHAFAPLGFHAKLQKGLLRKEDVPYMVRGGSWDNSDVFGTKKLNWSKLDKAYAAGGYKKEQSASLSGSGPGFDWAGSRTRSENLKNKIVPGFS
jgi:hypothetical protein